MRWATRLNGESCKTHETRFMIVNRACHDKSALSGALGNQKRVLVLHMSRGVFARCARVLLCVVTFDGRVECTTTASVTVSTITS